MGTARLDVWVSELGDGCRIHPTRLWYVHVLQCDGSLLVHGDTTFTNQVTTNGHVALDVPPGQYLVVATWSKGNGTAEHLGNHLTHMQIVRVNCGDSACVYLYAPTLHLCGHHFLKAIQEQMANAALDPKVAGNAIQAVERLLRTIEPDPIAEATVRLGDDAETKRAAARRPRRG